MFFYSSSFVSYSSLFLLLVLVFAVLVVVGFNMFAVPFLLIKLGGNSPQFLLGHP